MARVTAGASVSLLVLICGSPAFGASPGGALREYKAGNYDQALKDYEQLLKRKTDDPRLRFNAGAAAYRSGQYEDALKQFDQAAASPDLKLQESAYYNRGNSLFWLGEQNPDPAQRQQSWEKALKDFELSMKLNPNDPDAKFNHEFVKKRLEELKQQQQQQQQQDKSNQDKSDQQNQDQQQQSDPSKQEQNQQQQQPNQQDKQQQQQNQQDQKQDQSPEQPAKEQQKQQEQNSSTQQDQKQQEQKPPENQQQTAQGSEEQKKKEQEDQAAAAAGQMTPEQARQLLDAQKGQEKMLSQKLQRPVDRTRKFKDW